MIEGVLAWVCLGIALFADKPLYIVAAALFAIAAQLDLARKGDDEK